MIGVVVVVGEGAEWARRVHCAAVPGVESVANRTAFVFICSEWCFGFLFVAMYWKRLMFSARNVFGRVTHTGAVFFQPLAALYAKGHCTVVGYTGPACLLLCRIALPCMLRSSYRLDLS